ncbi:hypothetical protein EYV94_03905 [Puteibacter caeruleilacunae]|nr:hypothetical protein EYV94_03905 [Puteibacter caeruleilacunae]
MNKNVYKLTILFVFIKLVTYGQDVTTVQATSFEVGDNLDLKAVASVFGESENLEDFEKKLNDPKRKISNLDLNKDGQVDYLRIVEVSADNSSLVTIQAVLGKDLFQDVATIDVERDKKGELRVQVVGDVDLYGPDYIIDPYYAHSPLIYSWYWGPYYSPYYSPYYYGYYPVYYSPWVPYPVPVYQRNISVSINVNHRYCRANKRQSKTCVKLEKSNHRSTSVSVTHKRYSSPTLFYSRRSSHSVVYVRPAKRRR